MCDITGVELAVLVVGYHLGGEHTSRTVSHYPGDELVARTITGHRSQDLTLDVS